MRMRSSGRGDGTKSQLLLKIIAATPSDSGHEGSTISSIQTSTAPPSPIRTWPAVSIPVDESPVSSGLTPWVSAKPASTSAAAAMSSGEIARCFKSSVRPRSPRLEQHRQRDSEQESADGSGKGGSLCERAAIVVVAVAAASSCRVFGAACPAWLTP